MANVFEMGLDLNNSYPVNGNPSWSGEFGSNAYYAIEVNGITYIYDLLSGEIVAQYP